jgi:hypothetical protein
VTQRLAFVDESLRPGRYLLACVAVPFADAGELRRSVNGLLMSGERRLHLQRESKRRRRQILEDIAGLDLDATVYVAGHRDGRSAEGARADCLEQVVVDLQAAAADTQLFIERREGADDRDRATIIASRARTPLLNFEHLDPHADPLLWVPDCLAWAVGARGEWVKRVSGTVRVVDVG